MRPGGLNPWSAPVILTGGAGANAESRCRPQMSWSAPACRDELEGVWKMQGFPVPGGESARVAVGVCIVELYLGEAASLKDKRRVLKSILDRVRARFNVSIAEVDQQDLWQRATVAFVSVSNEQSHAYQVLNAVVKFLENQNHAQIISYQTEII